MMKAIVVFRENQGLWWLRFLKSGFRHCFIILETDRGCVWVDPVSNRFSIKILEGHELKGLVAWYRNMDMKVLEVSVLDSPGKSFIWAPLTCVEVVKRLIGLNTMFICTPWQLYKYIKRTKSELIRKNT